MELERKGQPGLLQTASTTQKSAEKAMERTEEGVWGEMEQLLGFLIGGKWHHSHSTLQRGNAKVETYRCIFTW